MFHSSAHCLSSKFSSSHKIIRKLQHWFHPVFHILHILHQNWIASICSNHGIVWYYLQLDRFYRITPNITATPQLSSPSPQLSEDDIKNSASSSGHLPYAKQYELGDEPQRKKFLDTFKDFMEQNGTPCLRVPMADNTNNIPLDLYKLYREVCRRNGMPEVRTARSFLNPTLWI